MSRIKVILFSFLLLISQDIFAQALKQKNLAELENDLKKINPSIETTQKKLKTINDATFLPDLYMLLAELYVDKSRYMFQIKKIRNANVPVEELDFANEKRPKQFAIDTYQKLIDKFPNYKERDKAMFFMAHEYREMGQLEDMVKVYQKLTAQYANSRFYAESQLIMGNYFFEEKKDLDYAHQIYAKVLDIKESPFKHLAQYKIGWVYINQAKWKEALLAFEKVLLEDPKMSLAELPEIYRKTDVRRDALTSMAWPYSELSPSEIKKLGEWRVDPILYFKKLSNNIVSYQKALARVARRLEVKKREVAMTRVYFELIKTTQDLDLRMEAIKKLYFAMKNSQKRWPVEGYVEFVTETLNRIRNSPDLDAKDKKEANFNYEIYARDGATRLQERAKQTTSSEDYRQAIFAYKSYLWAFPSSKYSFEMHLNLAESYFKIKKWVLAGIEYEYISNESKDSKKKKEYLDSSLEAYTKALKEPDNLNRVQLVEARGGLRDVGSTYVKSFPKDRAVPETMFNIGRSYYDERDYKSSEKNLTDYLTQFPSDKNSQLAVDLILDGYNQKEDFAGLSVAGQKILKIRGLSQLIYTTVGDLIKQAEYRKIQTKTQDLTSSKYSEELLKFAQKYKGSNLGDQALYEAFTGFKAKKDPRAYIPGEELLIKHANSKYAKPVVFEMGKMAVLTSDFRRASSYFEIFSSKYPQETEAKQLLTQAAQMRESMGDLPQAKIDFQKLKNFGAVARMDFMSNNWGQLRGSARNADGVKGTYWMGLAAYRLGNLKDAFSYLGQVAKTSGRTFEEKAMAAHSLYLLTMSAMKEYKKIQLAPGNEAQAVQAKSKMLERLTAQLNAVIKQGNGRWTIAALYGLGQSNKEFSKFIKAAPMPAGLAAAQQQQYRAAIEQQAKQFEDASSKFFKQCIDSAEKFEVFTNFVKGCQSKGDIVVDEESETKVHAQASENAPDAAFKIRQKLYDKPRSIELLTELSQAYTEGGDYPMANLILDRVLEIEKDHTASVAQKGMNYLFMSDLDTSQITFVAALKANPENVTALWGMAALYNQFNFKTRLGPALQKAKRAGNPKQPLHPWVRAIRF